LTKPAEIVHPGKGKRMIRPGEARWTW